MEKSVHLEKTFQSHPKRELHQYFSPGNWWDPYCSFSQMALQQSHSPFWFSHLAILQHTSPFAESSSSILIPTFPSYICESSFWDFFSRNFTYGLCVPVLLPVTFSIISLPNHFSQTVPNFFSLLAKNLPFFQLPFASPSFLFPSIPLNQLE